VSPSASDGTSTYSMILSRPCPTPVWPVVKEHTRLQAVPVVSDFGYAPGIGKGLSPAAAEGASGMATSLVSVEGRAVGDVDWEVGAGHSRHGVCRLSWNRGCLGEEGEGECRGWQQCEEGRRGDIRQST
jgi:hypothetical protein